MKLLTFAIPCYNSQDYMENCIKSLLPGGDDVEILIIDDGSKDSTGDIADAYEKKYPGIIRAIHQVNGGHGEAVNAGIRNATGLYFKVVDSDDWVDEEAYKKILDKLRELTQAAPVADPGRREEKSAVLTGEVASAVHPPKGCRFHPRCPYAREDCSVSEPMLLPMAEKPDHLVACPYYEGTETA